MTVREGDRELIFQQRAYALSTRRWHRRGGRRSCVPPLRSGRHCRRGRPMPNRPSLNRRRPANLAGRPTSMAVNAAVRTLALSVDAIFDAAPAVDTRPRSSKSSTGRRNVSPFWSRRRFVANDLAYTNADWLRRRGRQPRQSPDAAFARSRRMWGISPRPARAMLIRDERLIPDRRRRRSPEILADAGVPEGDIAELRSPSWMG